MFLTPRVRWAIGCVSVALLCLALAGGVRMNASDPMSEDAAIYLRDARSELVGGSMLDRVDAAYILGNLSERGPTGQYRRISRYGNTWILARISHAGPGGVEGISHMRTVYSLLLLASLLGIAAFLWRVAPADQGKRAVSIAVVSLVISGSPLFRYLNGNLISEVPALLMTTLAGLAFVHGLRSQRSEWCAVGGGLAFLAYTTRMDSLLTPVFLAIAGLCFFPRWYGWGRYLRGCALAATAFGLGLSVYVMLAGELVSPHVFLRFVTQASPHHFPLPAAEGAMVVVRTLAPFLVFMLASSMTNDRRLLRFAWTWLLLCLLPFGVLMSNDAWIETRFLALLLTPVALICLLGVDGISSALRNRADTPLGLVAKRALVPGLLAISLAMFSAPSSGWLHERFGWQIGLAATDQMNMEIVAVEEFVEKLEANGGRATELVYPRRTRFARFRNLFFYFTARQELTPDRQVKQVFAVIRTERWNADIENARRVATSRLRAQDPQELQLRILGRWNAWGLVVLTPP